MNDRFKITRLDGRSDAMVLVDLVSRSSPGRIFSFHELAEALEAGSTRKFDIPAIYGAVSRAQYHLLRTTDRTLYSVRGLGYKVSAGQDHRGLGLARKKRSDVQIKRGLQVMRHVKWDEMGNEERIAHQATLVMISALHQNQMAHERRLDEIERVIRNSWKNNKEGEK